MSIQPYYNLCYREQERELLLFCERENIAAMPWSPLARGYLARPHGEFNNSNRPEVDPWVLDNPYDVGGGQKIDERVQQLAADKGASMAQIALAWLLRKDVVTTPIIGTTSVEHLQEAVEAFDISLSGSDIEYLEEPYEPVKSARW